MSSSVRHSRSSGRRWAVGGADPDAEAAAAAEAEAAEAAAAAAGGASAGVQGDEAAEGGQTRLDSDAEDAKGTKGDGMSNKQRKMAARLKIADLKVMRRRPEVVEAWTQRPTCARSCT